MLVASEKLAALKPPTPTKAQDDRQKDNRARYGVAAYHWSPDSKSLLFDVNGHLWLYDLQTGVPLQLTETEETNVDPKFSPDAKYITFVRDHNLFLRSTGQGHEQQLTRLRIVLRDKYFSSLGHVSFTRRMKSLHAGDRHQRTQSVRFTAAQRS